MAAAHCEAPRSFSREEIVLRHKQLTSLDEQELRRGVEAINRRVLGEIGIAPLPKWPVI